MPAANRRAQRDCNAIPIRIASALRWVSHQAEHAGHQRGHFWCAPMRQERPSQLAPHTVRTMPLAQARSRNVYRCAIRRRAATPTAGAADVRHAWRRQANSGVQSTERVRPHEIAGARRSPGAAEQPRRSPAIARLPTQDHRSVASIARSVRLLGRKSRCQAPAARRRAPPRSPIAGAGWYRPGIHGGRGHGELGTVAADVAGAAGTEVVTRCGGPAKPIGPLRFH